MAHEPPRVPQLISRVEGIGKQREWLDHRPLVGERPLEPGLELVSLAPIAQHEPIEGKRAECVRMARVDRNVLRLAVFELKWRPDIPKKVTLNEAVELGKAFGTEASSAFVNGLLDRIALDRVRSICCSWTSEACRWMPV